VTAVVGLLLLDSDGEAVTHGLEKRQVDLAERPSLAKAAGG
jgi:hypothetical protein